ncbi:MAG: hypothetical protein AUJ92_16795 [Armatimonadetes bacterium CG2_30_59_28]|nr:MAG: hypothetical protein AUJ92_16795 [Armatimonadetes bacterium CG2_30_59_28]PIU61757.1 MAG: hypothetical protein COS85_20405 [Armatimonadetes bacterium CG07_land_8_20_14_0_80_59_28]
MSNYSKCVLQGEEFGGETWKVRPRWLYYGTVMAEGIVDLTLERARSIGKAKKWWTAGASGAHL